jgi:prepilin-type N-terminal cleavage/methylation domain-containing protein
MKRLGAMRGVTLIELLLAIAILSVIATSIFIVWINAERVYREADALADAQARARVVMRQMEREIRSGSRSRAGLDTLEAGVLEFKTIKPNTTDFVVVRYSLDGTNIVRDEGGLSTVVATDVSQLNVVGLGNSVRVELTVQVRDRSALLETTVAWRNP